MSTAIIYTRFSPRRNAEECASCETQEQICREHAAVHGLEVCSVHHDEGLSGHDWPRPGLTAALAELRKGSVLLVWRRDRVARSVLLSEMVQHQVTSRRASIVAVQGDVAAGSAGPEATLIRQVLGAVSEFERSQIAARTSAAMLARQRNGERMSLYAPFGYQVDKRRPKRLLPHPAEQEAVREILRLAEAGMTPWHIAKRLDETHPDACRGLHWSPKTVRTVVKRDPR